MYRTYRCLSAPGAAAVPGTTYDLDPVSAQRQPGIFQVAMSGATSARPKAGDPDMPNSNSGALPAGLFFLDTTLGYIVVSDGTPGGWRNPNTGGSV
jgi:hypothetical protein